MRELPDQLAPLSAYPQFILHKSKVPFSALAMDNCDPHDPANWMDAGMAISTAEMLGPEYGVGFVLTAADPFWCLDIDHCFVDGVMTPTANQFTQMFAEMAIEISQSGEGLHIWGMGELPPHGTRNREYGIEMYSQLRFIALTGNMMGDGIIQPSDMGWVTEYFPEPAANGTAVEWTTGPCAGSQPIANDDQLIAKAMTSGPAANAFTGKAGFSDLWNCNVPILAANYPDNDGERDFDRSAADMALASSLAFWTGKDCERIERLMRRSGLVREKWDRREHGPGYLKKTILRAADLCGDVYGNAVSGAVVAETSEGQPPLPPPPLDDSGIIRRDGYQLQTPDNQIVTFNGCTYIQNEHKILTPTGDHLDEKRFNVRYSGTSFILDSQATKTTNKAWEAFTASQAIGFPKVDSAAFRPLMPSGAIFQEEDRTFVNTYVPINTARKDGDPAPFLDWLKLAVPDEMDRAILITFIASVIRNPGVKPQWSILLQGMEGNGKSMVMRIAAFCVGWRYSYFPKVSDLANNGLKFNWWMVEKLLLCIEEIYTTDRHNLMEEMKPLTTESRMEVQAKGMDQFMADTPFAVLYSSNHRDALRVTKESRRYAVMMMAQQTMEDMERAGMTGDYFPNMYKWLRADGFAIMNNYLRTCHIEAEFDPAGDCSRAPLTTSTDAAVKLSLGGIEQEILDAAEEDRPGFAGGWISTIMLGNLLDKLRATSRIPPNKRREMLQNLGYIPHPALSDGRVNGPISQEGGKPRLYCKRDHLHLNTSVPADVMKAYCKAQGYDRFIDGKVSKV